MLGDRLCWEIVEDFCFVEERRAASRRHLPPPPITLGLAADGLKSNSRWGEMSDKLHGLTGFVQLRVTTELRLDRNRPGQAFRSFSLFCAEICEYSCGYLGPTAWSKQAEMSYCVPIAFGNVLRPPVDELLDRALHHDPLMQAPVLTPKPHKSVFDGKNTPLRDGRTFDIAPGITQKVLFSLEGLHVHDPPALLFVLEQIFKLVATYPQVKLARVQCPAQKCNHYPLPAAH